MFIPIKFSNIKKSKTKSNVFAEDDLKVDEIDSDVPAYESPNIKENKFKFAKVDEIEQRKGPSKLPYYAKQSKDKFFFNK